jgi:hypothetical protein
MQPFVIILILVIAPMVLGALLKMFKAYQEEVDRQSQRKRTTRNNVPTVPVSTATASTGRGQGEIDRFLQEIDKLRQKADSPRKPAPVKAVPVAKAVPKTAPRPEPPPFVPSTVTSRTGPITEVPVAKVVAPASRPGPALGPTAPKVTTRAAPAPTTKLGKDLAALLANKQSAQMAVVLQEILGPPKCRGRNFLASRERQSPE